MKKKFAVGSEISRRSILRAAGGIVIMLPSLEACSRAGGTIASAPQVGVAAQKLGSPATRFLGIKAPNGVVLEEWFPGGTETNFQLGQILSPLEAHKSNLIVIKGIDNVVSLNTPNRNIHYDGAVTVLTGEIPFVDPTTAGNNVWAKGISIDQVIANDIEARGIQTKKKSIQLGPTCCANSGTISWAGADQPLMGLQDPAVLFNMLFDGTAVSNGETAKRLAQRRSILDGTLADYTALATKVSGEDRNRIEAHLDALRDIEKRIFITTETSCDVSSVTLPGSYATDMAKRAMMFDITVLAMACDVTRVATSVFHWSGGGGSYFTIPGIGDLEMHAVSHAIVGEAPGGPEKTKMIACLRWFQEETARFIDKMKAVSTPDGGTLFDSTVIVQGSDCSYDHLVNDIPYLIMAGSKTPFRTGRNVRLPSATSHTHLLLTVLNAFNINVSTFGNPQYCTGNLNSVLT